MTWFIVMSHQKWGICPNFQFSHEGCSKGQDAGNSTDVLFIPLTQQFFFYGEWWDMPAESTSNDCRLWKGGTLLSLHCTLTWGDTLNREEMTWFLYEWCHNSSRRVENLRQRENRRTGPKERSRIEILMPNDPSHVSLNISWRWSSIVILCGIK